MALNDANEAVTASADGIKNSGIGTLVNLTPGDTVEILKPKWTDEEAELIVKRGHSMLNGLILPKDLEILHIEDEYSPYVVAELKYYREMKNTQRQKLRRCYMFKNMQNGLKTGVDTIDTLETIFVPKEELNEDFLFDDIRIDVEELKKDIRNYCLFDVFPKTYRAIITWTIEFLDIKAVYRHKRTFYYRYKGKDRKKEIFMDAVVLR